MAVKRVGARRRTRARRRTKSGEWFGRHDAARGAARGIYIYFWCLLWFFANRHGCRLSFFSRDERHDACGCVALTSRFVSTVDTRDSALFHIIFSSSFLILPTLPLPPNSDSLHSHFHFRRLHANPSDYTYDQSAQSPHPYLDSRSWVLAWGSLVRVPLRVSSRVL